MIETIKRKKTNRWLNGIVPAVLLTLPVGSVYAFSMFSGAFAEACKVPMTTMQWAFSLSIFFLGMGAAFFGPIIEKDPGKAGKIAGLLFTLGLCSTAVGVKHGSFWTVLAGYGVLNGLAQGIAYLSPVKALVMWFPKHKGLAASVSIVSFGLGSTLCTWLAEQMKHLGASKTFVILACIYAVMMAVGSLLIRKPETTESTKHGSNASFSYLSLMKDRMFWHSWLFMFLNISAGLALIGCSVSIFKDAGIDERMVVVLMLLAGVFNGSFRLLFAWASDFLKVRINMWLMISLLSIAVMTSAGVWYASFIGIAVLLMNSTYGGGFSVCPAVLSDYYDNTMLSRVHGAVLSAWGIAGLIGNNMSQMVFKTTGHFWIVVWIIVVMHAFNVVNMLFARKKFISH
jgi:OFA family oxalate/formate antiporter-like MFS transporter